MDRDRVREIQRRAMGDWVAMMTTASPGARLYDEDGITASAAPACPDRSVVNSVVYSDAEALIGSLDRLAEFYDDAGIEAWTVWAPEFESEVIAALEAAGHKFDAKPAAMVLELSGWEARDLGALDWDDRADPATAGEINDRAYGLTPQNGIGRSLVNRPEGYRLYQARIDGRPACVVGTMDHGGDGDADLGFYFVATDPDQQGKGLTTRLMAVAIADAKERGFATSSLQASPAGEPVYRALGFEPSFRFHMYERRSPDSASASH
jgi:GNAT superfamily N-acetyltransferase